MKELATRVLSGLLYIVLILGSLYWSENAFLIVFFVLGGISFGEFLKLIKLNKIVPFILYAGLFFVFAYQQYSNYATSVMLTITIFVDLFIIKDLFSKTEQAAASPLKKYILAVSYFVMGLIFLSLIPSFKGGFNPLLVAGVFALIWINDSFAYLVGRNFGKQKLFERISPKKTVEGFFGGLFFSCLASYFIANFTEALSPLKWLVISAIVCFFGTLGDLIQSKIKRQAAVKDSGNIMPGHGGMYDRLDSILFTAPFVYLYLQILQYVP